MFHNASVGKLPVLCRTIRVVAVCFATVFSSVALAGSRPEPPTNLVVTAVSAQELRLEWTDPVTDSVGYRIERSLSAQKGFKPLAEIDATNRNYTDSGLTPNTTYYYCVRSNGPRKSSKRSGVAFGTTLALASDDTTPPTITSFGLALQTSASTKAKQKPPKASVVGGVITLNATVTDDTAVARVEFYADDALLIAVNSAPYVASLDTATMPNGLHGFFVVAYDTAGNSSTSATVTALFQNPPPADPSDLTATAISSSQIDLTWTDNSGNESGFSLERSVDSSFSSVTAISLDAEVTSYQDTGLHPDTAYHYRVKATSANWGASGYSVATARTDPVAPIVPGGLAAIAISSSQINVSWVDNSGNETGFEVDRATDVAGPWSQIAAPGVGASSYSDNGLSPSITYYYRVRATNAAGDSPDSDIASATTGATAPTAPSSLVASVVSANQIDLSWVDASQNETGFEIDRATNAAGPWSQIAAPAAGVTTYTDNGLNAATTYYYRVRAANAAGDSPNSNTANATTAATAPGAPSDLAASVVSASQINLAWADNSNNETGFEVDRAASASGPWTMVATRAAGTTSFSDIGLNAATTYYYRVRATNGSGDSPNSNTANATTQQTPPTAPNSLTASAASASQINLSWTDNSNNETGFEIDRATSATGPWSQIASTAAGTTVFSDNGLAAASTYYYRARATNVAGDSPHSNSANATTAQAVPTTPGSLSASAVSPSQIYLSWTDTSNSETGFEIDRATSAAGPWSQIATISANVTLFADNGLNASSTYYYRVRAANAAGDSPHSNTASATTVTAQTTPAAPSSLVASAVSASQINLSWTDNSPNETGFEVDRAASASGPWTKIATTTAGVTSFANSGLNAATTYHYRVRATNSAGDSPNSNTANATTQTTTPALIISPSNIVFTGEVGGPFPPPQQMTITVPGGGTWSTFDTSPWFDAMPTSGPSGGFTTLTPHTENRAAGTYTYPITVSSPGLPSVTLTITLILTNPPPPAAPSNLAASAVSASQINLNWTDNSSNETGFQLERSLSISGPWTQVGTTSAGATSYADTGLLASTLYYYRVRATNAAGDSGYSNQAVTSTLAGSPNPAAPSNLNATAVSLSQIDLYWTDHANNEQGFAVERSSTPGGPWTQIGAMGANATSYSDLTVSPSTTYYYRVSAFN